MMKKYLLVSLVVFSCSALAGNKSLDCKNAINTLEVNQCASIALKSAEIELGKYLKVSYKHNADDPELVKAIKVAQKDWQAYAASHCNAIYTQWRDGSIRGVMTISCKTRLTKQRTHEIWKNFLSYMDSTSPVLPEPDMSMVE